MVDIVQYSSIIEEIAHEAANNPPKEKLGPRTGLKIFDKGCYGMRPGSLYVVAARPSMGKSSLITSILSNLVKDDANVLLLSYEMTNKELAIRHVAAETGTPIENFMHNRFSDIQKRRIAEIAPKLKSIPVMMCDKSSFTIDKIDKFLDSHPEINVLAIDYLQLMPHNKGSSEYERISDLSRNLKLMAQKHDICIVLLSQLSRACESRADKRPIKSDLRSSGQIEQDADVIIFLHKESDDMNEDRSKNIKLILDKQRNGMSGIEFEARFYPEITKFVDAQGYEDF